MGEIWLKSRSCARGYWGLEERTKEDFHASLSMDMGEACVPGAGETGGTLE